ncbi:hypothetical protein TSOC_004078 [Tetrabaena socialis]|uniref:Nucleotide-diphospho-sugar transferase domain-containing protein n=1 Tax=Tetrabaena socialis TaxID=47790 RepID=A0A2J8AA01_9CHLO|nr:hypothetical protein TSOC_004078 [Tetrabaena socialis]|eukprot:PNH09313.1 hypothetical protein TSOC_004078 [Tetrabaena socialis]
MALITGRALARGAVLALVLLALRADAARSSKETFPVRRPLVDLREAAMQLVGRDGPRYPDEGFLRGVHASRAPYKPGGAAGPDDAHSQFQLTDCEPSYAILTMANQFAMQHLVPLLLRSLQAIAQPELRGKPGDLTRHTVVVGVTPGAAEACDALTRRFSHRCQGDGSSGLFEGDHLFPDHRALAYGLAKLKYIVNALTTNVDVLYLDADVVLLRDPFPGLLALNADLAVATTGEPCGSRVVAWDPDQAEAEAEAQLPAKPEAQLPASGAATGAGGWADVGSGGQQADAQQRRALQEGPATAAAAGDRYDTGVSYYRSAPGTLRCAYALLLDMAQLAMANVSVVWETERYAAFMPQCAGALGLVLRPLPSEQYIGSCGADVGAEARRAAVAVHASMAPGSSSSLRDRMPLMSSLLGIEGGSGGAEDGDAGASRSSAEG